MPLRPCPIVHFFAGAAVLMVVTTPASLAAQIGTDIVERNKAEFHRQAIDADMKREGGTQPRDWDYNLSAGVTTRQITFYVDGGTPLYGKMFFPKAFKAVDRRPAVVVGHGINALSIGIEKYAARFAEHGLVAMAIDYQSYGFSGSGSDDLRLLERDPTTDARAVSEQRLRVVVKRTNLNNAHEIDDYRAAISYLQGEPGVDPERIGIWGSSNAGSVVIAVAEIDTRAKAVVSQVAGPRPIPRGPAPLPTGQQAAMLDDAIVRARTGQGAEVDGGFSFKSKIDLFGNFRNRDVRPGAWLDQIVESTKILFLPAEKDELTGGPGGALEATKYLTGRGITAQTIVYPELTHFQAYSNTGFEVGSTLAADWFLKYLAPAVPAKTTTASAKVRR
jgi:dienelactone hydrolase